MDAKTQKMVAAIIGLKRHEQPDPAVLDRVEREFHRRLRAEILRQEENSFSYQWQQFCGAVRFFVQTLMGRALVPVGAFAAIAFVLAVATLQRDAATAGAASEFAALKLDIPTTEETASYKPSESLAEFVDFSRSLDFPSQQASAYQAPAREAAPVVYDEANISF